MDEYALEVAFLQVEKERASPLDSELVRKARELMERTCSREELEYWRECGPILKARFFLQQREKVRLVQESRHVMLEPANGATLRTGRMVADALAGRGDKVVLDDVGGDRRMMRIYRAVAKREVELHPGDCPTTWIEEAESGWSAQSLYAGKAADGVRKRYRKFLEITRK